MPCMVPSKATTVHQSASVWYQVFAVARREQCLLGVATLLGSALAAIRLGKTTETLSNDVMTLSVGLPRATKSNI